MTLELYKVMFYRAFTLGVGILLIAVGVSIMLSGDIISRLWISSVPTSLGFVLVLLAIFNAGSLPFADDVTSKSDQIREIMFKVTGFPGATSFDSHPPKSALKQNMEAREAKMQMLRERIAARDANDPDNSRR